MMLLRASTYKTALSTLAALSALMVAAPSSLAQNTGSNNPVQNGVDAWKAGDFDAAVRYWIPAANSGNADAQFNMGQAYKLGRGVVTSLSDAEIWYRRAAEQGHLQAEDNLGLTLFTNGKREEAMPYIRRSAARGEARAQFLLGTAHYNGDLAEKDWPRAYALIQRASETGLSLAKNRIVELNRLIPEEQRKAGLAMLPEMRRAEESARLAALPSGEAKAAPAAPSAPAQMARSSVAPPAPLQMVSLPASQVSASLDAATQPEPDDTPAPPPRPAAGVTFAAPPVTPSAAPSSPPAERVALTSIVPPAQATAAPVPAQTPPPPTTTTMPPKVDRPAPAPTPAPVPAPAAKPKTAPPAPAAAPAATGRWRAQLGSFAVPENARNMWKQASARYGELRDKKPIYDVSGRYTRLLAEGFTSQAQAAAFCAKVRANGGSCLVSSR